MEIGAEQVAARRGRAADQEYRRRSDGAVRSTENANLKRRRQRLAADYYETAMIDVSVDTTPNIPITTAVRCLPTAQCQY